MFWTCGPNLVLGSHRSPRLGGWVRGHNQNRPTVSIVFLLFMYSFKTGCSVRDKTDRRADGQVQALLSPSSYNIMLGYLENVTLGYQHGWPSWTYFVPSDKSWRSWNRTGSDLLQVPVSSTWSGDSSQNTDNTDPQGPDILGTFNGNAAEGAI